MWKSLAATFAIALALTVVREVGTNDVVHAATLRPLLLDEVIDSAAVGFHGKCVSNRVELDTATRFIVTYTTFEVRDVLKGEVAATHVIKQIGGVLPDGVSGMVVPGVPAYTVGEEYVVFLAGVSSLGFSSPVGLSQGSFAVQNDKTGKTVVTGRDLRELTANMPRADLPADSVKSVQPVRQLQLNDFKRLARTHATRLP
ncbi:MAG: hypothetical protein JNN20_00745 [Betaproteobacteria bacterium]|nr:hypothetical protein [Betaproteobacteria bacterium]